MKVHLTNTKLLLVPDNGFEERLMRVLVDRTSYFVEGYRFDERYKRGYWNGKKKLLKKNRASKTKPFGSWTSPVGLLSKVFDLFEEIKIEDQRKKLSSKEKLWMDKEVIPSLRSYQREAVESVLAQKEFFEGKGVLKLPTRSGKTVIAAALLCELGLPAVFFVQSDLLLQQTVKFFRKVIKGDTTRPLVTQFGGGENDPSGLIVVASIQATMRNPSFVSERDVVVFDECHHLTGDEWRKPFEKADARYKIGLSATVYFRDDEVGSKSNAIVIESVTGPILYELSPSRLVEEGWLCRPKINFVKVPLQDKDKPKTKAWAGQYKFGITENDERNQRIVDLAIKHIEAKETCLVTTKHISHTDRLAKMFKEKGYSPAIITGKTKMEKRKELLEDIKNQEKAPLIGTVFGEGVDLPWLDVVIVACGLSSTVLTMQRLRNLTPYCPVTKKPPLEPTLPPTVVQVYDFVDDCMETLLEHTLQRVQAYKSNPSYIVQWEDK